VQFLINGTAFASIYTLVFMSLDRFLAVVYPIESMTWRTEANCRKAVAATWVGTIFIWYTTVESGYMSCCTVGTRNKEQVGQDRIVPYCESFPYSKSSSFKKLNFGKHQHSVIASFFILQRSLLLRISPVFNLDKAFSWLNDKLHT